MLAGNKTNWERFAFGVDEVNHAWTSFPGAHFLKYIAGIQPTSGGFATFDVRPATGGLAFAEGTVPTIKGPIKTRWEKGAGGRFTLALTVPPNTTATVYVPAKDDGGITESGRPVATAQGVKFLGMEKDRAVYEVGSGCYEFASE
jgi:alpha-L-rhamnosidase